MAYALGSETLDVLSRQSMGREELLAGLSQHLPDLINQLTPNGRLPTEKADVPGHDDGARTEMERQQWFGI